MPGSGSVIINPSTFLPAYGLNDVLLINITVDSNSVLSDVWMHACYTPGKFLYMIAFYYGFI